MINKYFLILLLILAGMPSHGQGAGDFVSFQKSKEALIIQGTKGILKIQALHSDIFKIQTIYPGSASFDSSYTVVLKPTIALDEVTDYPQSLLLHFEQCTIEINKTPLRVALLSGTEVKIRENRGVRVTKDSVSFAFDINPKDVFHGAGARPFGPDLNRKAFDFYNTAEFAYYDQATGLSQGFNVPFIVSSHRYGILLDSDLPGSMRMYVGALDSTRLTVEAVNSGRWAYYLINGDSNDEILSNYTLLTGRQPLPPRWAFGYIQSKSGYQNESEATNAVSKLQNQGFPVDAVALDSPWYGGESSRGNFDWNAQNWPNPPDMIGRLRQKGVKTILAADPYIQTKSPNFRIADSLSILAKKPGSNSTYIQTIPNGPAGLLDIFKPTAQDWVWKQYKRLTDEGVAGWWTDKTEPGYAPDGASYTLGSASQTHNLYSFFWGQNLYNHYQKDYPDQRIFNLTSSGWAGSQRFGVLPWSGQVARYWAGLKLQIPIMVQSGMSGIAYMHSDAGGFATMSDKPEKDEELDLRWFQMATFSPMLRVNGQRSNVEPFNLTEPFYSTVKKYLNIRYQLLPYLYSLAWKNSTSGRPICMPMDYFVQNRSMGNVSDQYFFGENLLIAPVLLHGMPSRKVVFPEGKWFDFWTNTLQNSNEAFPKLTVDHIPVYARAGSFIPLATSVSMRSTEQYLSDSLTVKFYQDISVPSSIFTFFHDNGADPGSIKNGKFELIDITGKVSEDSIQIGIARKHDHAAALTRRVLLFEIENLTSAPLSVSLSGKSVPVVYLRSEFKPETAYYDLVNRQLSIKTNWDCNIPLNISVIRDGLTIITGVANQEDREVMTIFPNPAPSGKRITVQARIPESGIYALEICNPSGIVLTDNPLGKCMKGQRIETAIGSDQLHGAYILRLRSDAGKFYSKKIVVE